MCGNDKILSEFFDADDFPDYSENDITKDDLISSIEDLTHEVAEVQTGVASLKNKGDIICNEDMFNEMSDLTSRAVAVLDTVKADIERSTLMDADLIQSYSSLIKSTREIISDYILLYRDRQNFLNKIELEKIKQEHRKEILRLKDDLDKSIHDNNKLHKAYIQEAVIDILDDRKREKEAE